MVRNRKKRQFYKDYMDRKLRVTNRLLMAMIAFMFVSVIYDSFVHDLPFYYILFTVGGLLLGRVFLLTRNVRLREEDRIITQEYGIVGLVFLTLVLIFRFFVGDYIYAEFNVVYISDALYLTFIGFYFERIYNSQKQIDQIAFLSARRKRGGESCRYTPLRADGTAPTQSSNALRPGVAALSDRLASLYCQPSAQRRFALFLVRIYCIHQHFRTREEQTAFVSPEWGEPMDRKKAQSIRSDTKRVFIKKGT